MVCAIVNISAVWCKIVVHNDMVCGQFLQLTVGVSLHSAKDSR